MEKSQRNKTIDLTAGQVDKYLALCAHSAPENPDGCLDKVIVGDTESIAARLPEGIVDLMIADPPYNLSKNYNGSVFNRVDDAEYEKYTRAWLESVLPCLKKGASVYVCCDWRSSNVIGSVLGDYLCVRNRITWQRDKGRGAAKNWKNSMEDIWFATNGEDYKFNLDAVKQKKRVIAPYRLDGEARDWQEDESGKYRYTCPSNFWDDLTVPYWSMSENTVHPTQKPEKLLAKLILASSDEGDLVFDPFLGSGTTAVTAKKLGRRYLGIEREQKYCAIAAYRLEKADADKRIQGYEDGVFLSRNQG